MTLPYRAITTTWLHVAGLLVLSLLMSSLSCYSADVVFVGTLHGSSPQLQELEIATNFYGLNVKVVRPGTPDSALRSLLESKSTVGAVIAADILAQVSEETVFNAFRRRSGGSVPLLILGVTPETNVSALNAWSGGAVTACRHLEPGRNPMYIVGQLPGVTQQLTGFEISVERGAPAYLEVNDHSDTSEVAMLRDGRGAFPVFVKASVRNAMLFVDSTSVASNNVSTQWNGKPITDAFAALAPAMMFIRYCAGERGWHVIHHYANFTIDDPWLRESYGFLQYKTLLGEMERHNFHSTIAFIPWNYDRSEPQVVSLIRAHPDRFSISVHGDNHDHKEFTDYQTKPLGVQIEDIGQSLARMDRFQALTGIPYDKVMIFPHSIAPEMTLAALKHENYLATVNSSNVPMDISRPSDLSFELRATTLNFSGLSSIRRYSVEGLLPQSILAVNLFLENPLLFYAHQEFFASGIDAFDAQADYVNKLQPDTRWRSLGEIVRHLYLVKLRDDENYDVLSFASTITLENAFGRDSLFYVRKQEGEHPATVTVDQQSWPYELRDGYLEMQVPIASGRSRAVSITYQSDPELRAIGIEKRSLGVYGLRMASDFRDIVVARFGFGRSFIHLYQENGEPLKLLLVCFFVVMVSCAVGVWRLRMIIKHRAAG
jgi:hypothetical protein